MREVEEEEEVAARARRQIHGLCTGDATLDLRDVHHVEADDALRLLAGPHLEVGYRQVAHRFAVPGHLDGDLDQLHLGRAAEGPGGRRPGGLAGERGRGGREQREGEERRGDATATLWRSGGAHRSALVSGVCGGIDRMVRGGRGDVSFGRRSW